jgi:hypothetical protein
MLLDVYLNNSYALLIISCINRTKEEMDELNEGKDNVQNDFQFAFKLLNKKS